MLFGLAHSATPAALSACAPTACAPIACHPIAIVAPNDLTRIGINSSVNLHSKLGYIVAVEAPKAVWARGDVIF